MSIRRTRINITKIILHILQFKLLIKVFKIGDTNKTPIYAVTYQYVPVEIGKSDCSINSFEINSGKNKYDIIRPIIV